MANNRMFLVHVPTGLAVGLGKRMAFGWYMHREARQGLGGDLFRLFDVLESLKYKGAQDDFALAMEDANGAKSALGDWYYGPHRDDGLVQLVMNSRPEVDGFKAEADALEAFERGFTDGMLKT